MFALKNFLLPHESLHKVVAACIAVTSKIGPATPKTDSMQSEDNEGIVFLHCQALLLRARIQAAQSPDEQLIQPVLQLLRSHPGSFHALATAADIFEGYRTSDALLPESQLMELLPLLASNLSVRSQSHRAAALKVLCSFQQPALPSPGSGQAADNSRERSDILPRLAQIESQTCTLDSGRAAATAIGRMKTALEYGRVPPALVGPLVRNLLGILYVRFSMLWAPASEALGMALKSNADVAWPLILDALRAWQAEFLSGSGKPHNAPGTAAEEDEDNERLQTIEERFRWLVAEGSEERSGGCTDAAMRMTNLLKALAAASTEALEPRSADWVPLLLAYLGSRSPQISEDTTADAADAPDADGEEGNEEERRSSGAAAGPSGRAAGQAGLPRTYVGARAWRALAKEWMAAVAGFKSLRGVHRWKEVRSAVALQLLASDPSLQQAALKCLKGFKLKYLGPYMERLLRLAADATLREELMAFPLSPTADAAIQPEHRAGLTAVLVRLLWPKMRKRSGRLGGKGAPGSARAAILNFLTALEPPELRPLLVLFLIPLGSGFAAADPAGPPAVAASAAGDPPVVGAGNTVGAGRRRPAATAAAGPPAVAGAAPARGVPAPNAPAAAAEADALFAEPWWAAHLGQEGGGWWLAAADSAALAALPSRQCVGFLNATGDLLRHLGHKLEAYLPEIVALLVCLLEGATASLPNETPAQNEDIVSPVAEPDTSAAVNGASKVSNIEEGESDLEEEAEKQVQGGETAAEQGSTRRKAAGEAGADGHLKEKARDADMGAREVRSGALRLLAAIWARFPAAADYGPFWPRFFSAAAPLLPRMLVEASADKAPPLLEVAAALAATPNLASLLGNRPSQVAASEGATCPTEPCPEPWASQHHLGSRLLQQTIAVLAAPHASEAAHGVALGTLESVLDLGSSHADVILGPHTRALLESLRELVAAAAASGGGARPKRLRPGVKVAARGPTRADALRALAVLERVAAGGGTAAPDLAQQLSEALLPILTPGNNHGRGKRADEAAAARVLGVLGAVWSQAAEAGGGIPQEHLWRYAAALAPLAGSLASHEARAAHTAAFDALGCLLPPLQRSARLLSGLNAMSATELDAPDYDARLGAYSELDQAAWGSMRATEALPLLHAALADIRNGDDLAARAAASQALSRLIAAAAAAAALGDELEAAVPEQQSEQSGDVAGGGNVVGLAERVLYSQLKRTLASPNLAVRQEHVDLLRQLVCAFPTRFQDLMKLTDPDPELDFFNNVAHLQLHRRSRAFYRLKKAAEEGSLGAGALLGIAVPLLQQVIVEGKEGEGAGHERKEKDRDREANVSAAAIEALGAVAGSLGWSHYRELLNIFMRVMQKNDSKAVIRALCAIIDAFHFPTAATSAEGGADISADAAEIQTALTKRVLPALQMHLVNTEREAVRAPVALAVVKLLKHLPPAAARAALPAALQKVANLLKLRLQRIRDDARTVLVAMVAELGPGYLHYAIDTLRSALPRRGYMGHVQAYTVHALLAGLMKNAQPGALDDVMEDVLEVIEAEVWGEIGEEKEAGAFVGGCKEAKRARGIDSYQLLASGITFRTHIGPLLQPVTERLSQASSPAVRGKLQALLQAAIQGVAVNPTVTTADLLVFVHSAMDAGLAAEEAARAAATAAAEAAGQAPANGSAEEVDGGSARHQHLMVEAALRLLLRALRKGNAASDRSPANLGMMDGLLPVLGRALRSRHAAVTERALRCLALLAPLPLPGLPTVAPEAGAAVLSMLRNAPDCNAPIAQEGFKLLAALLRSCSSYKPKEGQLRDLLARAFADVEAAANTVAAFNLLKAVIARRLVLPEVYDLMSRVQELMIKSHSASVRAQCSAILLAFLLDYPLGGARLSHHLNFLVANAGFEHEAGRAAALDAMLAVIQKFPDSLLETWAPVFFVPLVARLVSDPSPKCRALVGRTLKALLLRATPVLRDRFASHCLKWLAGSDARLGRAAAQTLGILAEAEGTAFGRRTGGLLPQLLSTLRFDSTQEDEADGRVDVTPPENAAPGWQVCYACLLLLEKIVTSSPAQVRWAAKSGEVREVWLQLPQLLTHRHLWVRKAASRLLGLAFADSGIGEGLLAEEEAAPGRLAFLLFIQLEAEAADEALLSQATKNLVFLAPRLLAGDLAAGRVPLLATAKSGDAANTGNGDAGNGSAAGEEADGIDVDADVDDDVEGGGDGATVGGHTALTLHGLIRRMARLADDRSWPRQGARLAALRFTAALASRLGRDDIPPYLPTMLLPLYRITEGNAANPDEVKALAEEVLAHLREVAGPDALLAAYNRARQTVNSARSERRRQRALQAMLDPEAAAQARMRKQERRAVGRKRAMEETRRLRSAGIAVKHKRPRGPKRAQ
ncbi:probable small subunit processome component 20 homolog [Coccomyxa sp. Obi]|nr:probable small subunit processome component 20 homolog [Coccomyxa sp. Obi]